MSAGRTQVLLFAGAVALFVLLFIAPRIKPSSAGATGNTQGSGGAGSISAMEVYEKMAVKSLAPEHKEKHDRFAGEKAYDSLQHFWLKHKHPEMSALVAERKALASNKADDYFLAGNRYYNAVRFTSDNSAVPVLFQSAIRCFKAGLEKDPSDTDAKIMLASSYVEGSSQPMEGIRLLREVEAVDSSNIKLQLSFAFFSVKSGQLDKAIERFNKVLAIDSNYVEAYLHLADAYEQQQNTEATIEVLRKYMQKTDDITAKLEVAKYIDQLKTRNNN